jgi:hypothetical protein
MAATTTLFLCESAARIEWQDEDGLAGAVMDKVGLANQPPAQQLDDVLVSKPLHHLGLQPRQVLVLD